MDAVGDGLQVAIRNRQDGSEHVPGHFPVSLADGIGRARAAQGECSHVKQVAVSVIVKAQFQKRFMPFLRGAPIAGKLAFHLIYEEGVMSCRYGSVGREDGGGSNRLQSRLQALAGLHQLPNPLDNNKRRMTFVQMPDRWVMTEHLQCPDASNAKNYFLAETCFTFADIESRREVTSPARVLLHIGIEQVELNAAHPDQPHPYVNALPGHLHHDGARLAGWSARAFERRLTNGEAIVSLNLPPFCGYGLLEVA